MELEATAFDHRANPWKADLSRRITRAAGAPQSVVAEARGGLAPWQLACVRRHIERHLASRLTNAGLAALVRLNEDHFARAFKVSVGRPPHAYLMERRVEHAKFLLLRSNLPVCQIALASGFADQAHMTRRFRQTADISPASWRRQSRARTR